MIAPNERKDRPRARIWSLTAPLETINGRILLVGILGSFLVEVLLLLLILPQLLYDSLEARYLRIETAHELRSRYDTYVKNIRAEVTQTILSQFRLKVEPNDELHLTEPVGVIIPDDGEPDSVPDHPSTVLQSVNPMLVENPVNPLLERDPRIHALTASTEEFRRIVNDAFDYPEAGNFILRFDDHKHIRLEDEQAPSGKVTVQVLRRSDESAPIFSTTMLQNLSHALKILCCAENGKLVEFLNKHGVESSGYTDCQPTKEILSGEDKVTDEEEQYSSALTVESVVIQKEILDGLQGWPVFLLILPLIFALIYAYLISKIVVAPLKRFISALEHFWEISSAVQHYSKKNDPVAKLDLFAKERNPVELRNIAESTLGTMQNCVRLIEQYKLTMHRMKSLATFPSNVGVFTRQTGRLPSVEDAELISRTYMFLEKEMDRTWSYARISKDTVDRGFHCPVEIIGNEKAVVELYAKVRAIRASFSMECDLPDDYRIFADERFYRDAVGNMLLNAVDKFKGKDELKVNIRLVTRQREFITEIADSGPGIKDKSKFKDKDVTELSFPPPNVSAGRFGYALQGHGSWAHQHGGRLLLVRTWHKSDIDRAGGTRQTGTTFRLILPQPDLSVDAERTDRLMSGAGQRQRESSEVRTQSSTGRPSGPIPGTP